MEISRTFTFEAAHRLLELPEGHKCRRLHGHSYRVTVWFHWSGGLDPDERGFAGLDFADIDAAWAEQIHSCLDHTYLNDTFNNPTAEIVAMWIHEQMELALQGTCRVELQEGPRSRVSYP